MSTGNFSDAFGDERGRASLRTVDARLGKLRAQVGDDPDLALAGLARMAKEELLDLPDWRSIADPLRPAAFEDIVAALCTLVIEQAADRALPFITDRLDDLKVHPKTRPSLFSDEVRSQAQATVRRQIIWGLDDETQNRTVADLVKEAVGSLDHTLLLAAAQLLRAEPGALERILDPETRQELQARAASAGVALEPALLDDYTWRALLSNGCEQPNYRFVAAVKARLAPALEPASA